MTARKPKADTPAPDPVGDATGPELELPPAVFLIHPDTGHVVHVAASAVAELGAGEWAAATAAEVEAAGLGAL